MNENNEYVSIYSYIFFTYCGCAWIWKIRHRELPTNTRWIMLLLAMEMTHLTTYDRNLIIFPLHFALCGPILCFIFSISNVKRKFIAIHAAPSFKIVDSDRDSDCVPHFHFPRNEKSEHKLRFVSKLNLFIKRFDVGINVYNRSEISLKISNTHLK